MIDPVHPVHRVQPVQPAPAFTPTAPVAPVSFDVPVQHAWRPDASPLSADALAELAVEVQRHVVAAYAVYRECRIRRSNSDE